MQRTTDPESTPSGVWAPLALTAVLVVVEVLEGPATQYVGVLTAMPLLAAALVGPLATAAVGAVVLAAAFGTGFVQVDQDTGDVAAFSQPQLVRLALIAAAAVLAVIVARTRVQRAGQLRRVAGVADAAQRAILRPVPSVVGPLECASVYLSATSEATIGGDLVEVLDTPFGVRAIVGDVRGKGLDAVRLAGQVLGSFREVAWTVGALRDVALPLDRAVRRDAGPEDFVTAVLVQMTWDGVVTTCSCGHPPPYVVAPGGGPARTLEVDPSPPLGMLGSAPVECTSRLGTGERLVLVTDGLLEARRPRRWFEAGPWRRLARGRSLAGRFLPVEEVLGARLAAPVPVAAGLAEVVEDVRRWTRGRLADDLAVLVLQVRSGGTPRRHRRPPR